MPGTRSCARPPRDVQSVTRPSKQSKNEEGICKQLGHLKFKMLFVNN